MQDRASIAAKTEALADTAVTEETVIIEVDNGEVDKPISEATVVEIVGDEIIVVERTDDTAVLIVAISAGVLAVLALLLLARYFYNRMRSAKAGAEQIKATMANLNKDGPIRVIPREKNGGFDVKIHNGEGDLKEDGEKPGATMKGKDNDEVYEEQYDPNQEFRIFGIGDKTKGGVQSLQEKMNMADDLDSEGSSDDDKENGHGPATEPADVDAYGSAQKLMDNLAVNQSRVNSRESQLDQSAGNSLLSQKQLLTE